MAKQNPYKKGHTHVLVRNVDTDEWREFQRLCFDKKISASEAIRSFIRKRELIEGA